MFSHESTLTGGTKSVAIEAKVTRADGTVEELGTVAYWHRNPIKRVIARLRGVRGKVKAHGAPRPRETP